MSRVFIVAVSQFKRIVAPTFHKIMKSIATTNSLSASASETSAKPVSMLSARLQKHFAAGVAAVVVGSAAPSQATVIFTSTNLPVPATSAGLYLNFVTGVSNTNPASVLGWDVNPFSGNSLSIFSPTAPAGGAYVASGGLSNLPSGTLIDVTSTYATGRTGADTQWALNSGNNLVGARFLNEVDGQVHYGWMRLSVGATTLSRSITEYAYEDAAGVGILAGAVPEPTTLSLFAAGAFVLGRRRRQQS